MFLQVMTDNIYCTTHYTSRHFSSRKGNRKFLKLCMVKETRINISKNALPLSQSSGKENKRFTDNMKKDQH